MKKSTNKQVGEFIITDLLLGEGGFAKVFLCHLKNNKNIIFAAKTYDKKKLESDPAVLKAVNKEIEVLKVLRHDNIMRIKRVLETNTSLYLILEYCDAENLEDLIERYMAKFNKTPSLTLIKHLLTEIAKGLNHIHQNNFIHRDLKPDNIMITFSEEAMVELKKKYKGIIDEEMIDSFDQKSKNLLSQAMRISARNSITESKTIDNTIDYEKLYNKEYFYYNNTFLANPEIFEEILLMSSVKIIDLGLSSKVDINGCAFTVCYNPVTVAPEMIDILCNNNNSGKSSEGIYDNRIDLWSLGCIIYFMAVGKYPFTLLKDNKKDLQNDFEIGRYYIKKTSNNISYQLIDLISRLLQKKKELRINSQSVLMHAFIVNPIELQHMVNLDDIKSEYLSEKSTLINLNINECMNVKNIIKESSLTKNLSKNEIYKLYLLFLPNEKFSN